MLRRTVLAGLALLPAAALTAAAAKSAAKPADIYKGIRQFKHKVTMIIARIDYDFITKTDMIELSRLDRRYEKDVRKLDLSIEKNIGELRKLMRQAPRAKKGVSDPKVLEAFGALLAALETFVREKTVDAMTSVQARQSDLGLALPL
ncbi:MAG: hypothetical protein HUK26_06800 [Duodenibacillus sp.]|nr:hypothetical protein [Duodenibacillus sp.]